MSKNGALGESAGVGFIGAIASMASKMVGPGMVTKLLTPLLAKIPEPWGKKYGMAAVIKQVVVDLLNKKALIEGIFKYGVTKVTNVVKSMTQKLPGFAQK